MSSQLDALRTRAEAAERALVECARQRAILVDALKQSITDEGDVCLRPSMSAATSLRRRLTAINADAANALAQVNG